MNKVISLWVFVLTGASAIIIFAVLNKEDISLGIMIGLLIAVYSVLLGEVITLFGADK